MSSIGVSIGKEIRLVVAKSWGKGWGKRLWGMF